MDNQAPQLSDISIYLENLLKAIVPLIGFLAFIMILVGGFTILTAGSSAENLEKGKKTLTFAVIGLVLTILSWLILAFIEYLTGAQVTQFKLGF